MEGNSPSVFIIAGMPRCGTTFLYHNLQKHPSVFCPFRKETNYFSVNHHRGIEWYRDLYRDIRPGQIGADVSPSYFLHGQTIARIIRFNPDTKIVLGIRDPAEWSLSFYNQLLTHMWRGHPPFAEFIYKYSYPVSGQTIPMELSKRFVTKTIEQYRQVFGHNVLLYDFAFFQRSPLGVLRAIEHFLDLPHYYTESNFDHGVINSGNRRNIGFITYIVSRDSFASAVTKLVPRKFIQSMRYRFDKLSKDRDGVNKTVYTPENICLAQETFAEEGEWVQTLFSKGTVQLGSGQLLHVPT